LCPFGFSCRVLCSMLAYKSMRNRHGNGTTVMARALKLALPPWT